MSTFAEFMVLDTACQRTCCSTKWLGLWETLARDKFDLFAKKTSNEEPFEFGHGEARYSHMHVYLLAAFDHTLSTCLIGTCINSTNDIPLLGSHHFLSKINAIIDLPRGVLCLGGNAEVPIEVINGHLAVKITCFPDHPKTFHEFWKRRSHLSDAKHADVEMICMTDVSKYGRFQAQDLQFEI